MLLTKHPDYYYILKFVVNDVNIHFDVDILPQQNVKVDTDVVLPV